jgi:phage/plasmid-like protein (TIGR03299 family)
VGFTSKRGNAWHYKATDQGIEPNHYEQAIPVEDVRRRLFNWQAVEAPVFVQVPDNAGVNRYIEQTDRKAIVRNDTYDTLGMFKDSYQIHQYNEWLIGTISNIIDDSNLQIGSAGLLRNGGVAWVSIEMPETVQTKAGFEFRPHLLGTTSHNGTLATTFKRTVTAVVCDNTLAGALGESGSEFKTRHSKFSNGRIQDIRDALGIIHTMADEVSLEIERLSSLTVTQSEWDAIVERLVPVSIGDDARPQAVSRAQNKQELIRHLYKNDPRCAPWVGTGLGVLQAFNTWTHHYSGKDESRVERNAMNALNGKTDEFDRQVLRIMNDVVLV